MIESERNPKRKRRLLRFSLRTFLIVVTLLCVWLAWYVYRVERQRDAVRWVEERGGRVYYDYQMKDSKPPGPKWLRGNLGVDYFATVERVDLSHNPINDLKPLESLTGIKTLSLSQTQVSDLTPLGFLTNLETLNLWLTQVRDVTPLESLTNLQILNLRCTQVSDMTPLGSLENLKKLDLTATPVSDVTPLVGLTNLEYLELSRTQVSDVTSLRSLTKLKTLNVWRTNASAAEIDDLQQALPNCIVYRDQ